jgi:2,4-dienoyl-CoA reductase (NADPH2)
LPHVLSYADAFAPVLGARVVIIGGGGIAVDAAHYASAAGQRTVTVLHRGDRVGTRLGRSTRWAVLGALRASGVQLRTSVHCTGITPERVEIRDRDGAPGLVPADTVVIAVGQETDDSVAGLARKAGIWHRLVGGARDPVGLDAIRALSDAQQAAAEFAAR